jgi:hypothetical protein
LTDAISYSWGGAIETDFISVIRGCDEIHFYSLNDGLIVAEIPAFTDNTSWGTMKKIILFLLDQFVLVLNRPTVSLLRK